MATKRRKPLIMLTTGLNPDDWHWLKKFAEDLGVSQPAIIREAIHALRDHVEKTGTRMLMAGEKND